MIEITTHVRGAAAMRATAAYLQALALIAEADAATARGQTLMGGAVIKPEDRPDAGAPLPPVAPQVAALIPPANDVAAAVAAFVPSVPVPPPAAAVPAAPSPASATAVPPAPPAVAPAPPAGGSVNAAGKQLDSRGLPHDGRIHSTPPTITDKGVWRKKRGLNDETLVKRVEAELLAGQAIPAPATAAVPVPPVPAAPVPMPHVPVVPSPTDLPSFMQQLAPLLSAQRIDMPRVLEACKTIGAESLAVLQSRPDLVPGVWAEVQKQVTQ